MVPLHHNILPHEVRDVGATHDVSHTSSRRSNATDARSRAKEASQTSWTSRRTSIPFAEWFVVLT